MADSFGFNGTEENAKDTKSSSERATENTNAKDEMKGDGKQINENANNKEEVEDVPESELIKVRRRAGDDEENDGELDASDSQSEDRDVQKSGEEEEEEEKAKQPFEIPRSGVFYLHDDRFGGDDEADQTEEKDPEVSAQSGSRGRGSKLWSNSRADVAEKWSHDKFEEMNPPTSSSNRGRGRGRGNNAPNVVRGSSRGRGVTLRGRGKPQDPTPRMSYQPKPAPVPVEQPQPVTRPPPPNRIDPASRGRGRGNRGRGLYDGGGMNNTRQDNYVSPAPRGRGRGNMQRGRGRGEMFVHEEKKPKPVVQYEQDFPAVGPGKEIPLKDPKWISVDLTKKEYEEILGVGDRDNDKGPSEPLAKVAPPGPKRYLRDGKPREKQEEKQKQPEKERVTPQMEHIPPMPVTDQPINIPGFPPMNADNVAALFSLYQNMLAQANASQYHNQMAQAMAVEAANQAQVDQLRMAHNRLSLHMGGMPQYPFDMNVMPGPMPPGPYSRGPALTPTTMPMPSSPVYTMPHKKEAEHSRAIPIVDPQSVEHQGTNKSGPFAPQGQPPPM